MESAQRAEASGSNGAARPVMAHVVAFDYPASTSPSASPMWEGFGSEPDSAAAAQASASEASLRVEVERRIAEEARKAFEAGRERGRQEVRQAERETQTAQEEQRRHQTAELVEAFARDRERYFLAIEREVVELALAVATRILRREAQMDPLLLTGAVRVALGQLSASTKVTLRVPIDELDLWTEAMALLPKLAVKPPVVAGAGMRLGDCAIETALGTVDLGIRSQLGEIERGFFDRTQGRNELYAISARPAEEPKTVPSFA